jgi:hypothetical protein
MATNNRIQLQIDVSPEVRKRAKMVATDHDMTLIQLVLTGLTKFGDKDLNKAIEKDLAQRSGRGRPQK